MGCDIHIFYEKNVDGKWVAAEDVQPIREEDLGYPFGIEYIYPFDWRCYSMFSWLCEGVRDYCGTPSISRPRGLPNEASDEVVKEAKEMEHDRHSESWLQVDELINYEFKERYKERNGEMVTPEEFFGPYFFASIDELNRSDCERIVFWFDN